MIIDEFQDSAGQMAPPPYGFTWSFVLRPDRRGSTRLIVRERCAFIEPWAAPLVEGAQLASFVMTRGMLQGIKERAERRRLPVHVPAPTAVGTRA